MEWQLMVHVWNSWTRNLWDAAEYRRGVQASIEGAKGQMHQIARRPFRRTTNIRLPAETWAEVLPSCGQKSLRERICFTRRLFHVISRPLLDGPNGRMLPKMAFTNPTQGDNVVLIKRVKYATDDNELSHLVELPIAQVPPPQSVVGFRQILLKYFNAEVLSFLCTIRSILEDIWLELSCGPFQHNKWSNADKKGKYQWNHGSNRHNLTALECLLRVFPRQELAITSLHIRSGTELISAALLARLLTNVHRLRINGCMLPLPESMSLAAPYSHNCSPYVAVLVEWLHTPMKDGRQKLASLNVGRFENLAVLILRAQEHFVSANSTPVPYFVALNSCAIQGVQNVELPFRTLRNERTGEALTLRHYSPQILVNSHRYNFTLFRRICAPTEQSSDEEAELLAARETLSRALSSTDARNKVVLNVTEMSEVDESLFPRDAEDEPKEEEVTDGNDEPGPSSA